MKVTFPLQRQFLFLVVSLISLPLLAHMSEPELVELINNRDKRYVYCDRDHSRMPEIIAEIIKLDSDKGSPVWLLHEHMEKYRFGREESIMQALDWAAEILNKNWKRLRADRFEHIQVALTEVMDAIADGKLSVDTDFSDTDFLRTPPFRVHGGAKFYGHAKFNKEVKFEDKVKFEGRVKFDDDVKFNDDVTFNEGTSFEGTLSASDAVISGELTAGSLNIETSCPNSPDSGIISVNGMPFISNFGSQNTFVGANSGNFTMTGANNAGFGTDVLNANTSGLGNTAAGASALALNTEGSNNAALGVGALGNNTTGSDNVALGASALNSNITGSSNIAMGTDALLANTWGNSNVAIGGSALESNITGSRNIAIGTSAGANLVTGNDNIYLGNVGVEPESGVIRIGTLGFVTGTYIQGIFGQVALGGLVVDIDSTGKLGTSVSSAAFKRNINTMDRESEKLYRLRPVTFSYKSDATNANQYGLIAEEVAEVFPALVVNDRDGRPYSVRYQVLPVLLLNEVQKQRAYIADLAERVDRLERA